MTIWGQTVRWNGPAAYLSDFVIPVRIFFHPLNPGYYAVFARAMVSPYGGTAMFRHAAHIKISLGTATDEDFARLVCETTSGQDAIKASTPLELMTVGEASADGEGGVDVIAQGEGAVISAVRLNIISLDEIKNPADYEGSFPLAHADEPLHMHDYSRDIFVPVERANTEVEGGASGRH